MLTINIKVVVFGKNAVGKTSLLNACVCKSESDYESYRPFENVSTMTITLTDNIINDVSYKLDLWDTKSVDSYKIIEEMKNCEFSVALLCYSVMDISSFEEIKKKVNCNIQECNFFHLKLSFSLLVDPINSQKLPKITPNDNWNQN